MTVESTTNKAGPYIATGTGGTFPRPFLLLDEDHLRVIRVRDGVEADITSVGHTGIGEAEGEVVIGSGLVAGDLVYLLRAVPNLQRSDYNDQGRVRPEQIESDFDLVAMMIQDLAERQGRALTLSVASELGGEAALQAAIDAPRYATEAMEAAKEAAVATEWSVPTLPVLLASTRTYPVGSIIRTRKEGYAFEVIGLGDDPDLLTAGGVYLRALPDADGFVHLAQYGAIADGNRYTGTGTDNTLSIRRAFATSHNINIGWGTFAVRNTIQNLKENRIVKGSGMGMCCSSPIQDRLYFNAPSCILAIGDTATKRVITRRKYRASAASPNDPALAAVIENWGAGSTYKDFSIELFCDYTNMARTNLGANWDVGFFNGCRSNVGLDHVSILGYFRAGSTYWDVTDAYGLPNVLDIYGVQVPIPTAGADAGPNYGRGSGSDGCWMHRCEIRGRLPRVILGPDRNRTGAPYYDWVTNATYADDRGQSGASDFRSRDCILRAEHHSNYRMKDPIGYGSTLTYANMMLEPDFAPAVQYIDSGNTNGADVAGPTAAARGIILDDLRYVTREAFSTRLGQVKELYFGQRTWAESNGTPSQLFDTAGGDIFANRVNEDTHFYGHLCTNADTGRVTWENTVLSIFTKWVYSWEWTQLIDRQGRKRGLDCGMVTAPAGGNGTIKIMTRSGGHISIVPGGIGSGAVLLPAAAFLAFDVANTPLLQAGGLTGASVTILNPETTPDNGNTPDGNISFSAWPGEIRFRNRLPSGETLLAWSII
ncbi:hypothetical protein [Paracoccus sp. SM22M-07]|uniref:hypothetical protein n=1 Tax=Paracoccus sp. SM22M-07 TaxID=1520813 RepID=UPI00091DFAFD|nr:hypothetical protein [Paracoccus sp. SM22M-07]OJH45199.1 hypothetical protein IE00_05950 [Paracoccus sp. SM22M-07]